MHWGPRTNRVVSASRSVQFQALLTKTIETSFNCCDYTNWPSGLCCWCLHWMQSINWTALGLREHTQRPADRYSLFLEHHFNPQVFRAVVHCLDCLLACKSNGDRIVCERFIASRQYQRQQQNDGKHQQNNNNNNDEKKRIFNLVHRSNNGWCSEWFFLDWLKAPLREINDSRWCNCCGNLLMIWQIETRAVKLLPIDWIATDAGAMLL